MHAKVLLNNWDPFHVAGIVYCFKRCLSPNKNLHVIAMFPYISGITTIPAHGLRKRDEHCSMAHLTFTFYLHLQTYTYSRPTALTALNLQDQKITDLEHDVCLESRLEFCFKVPS